MGDQIVRGRDVHGRSQLQHRQRIQFHRFDLHGIIQVRFQCAADMAVKMNSVSLKALLYFQPRHRAAGALAQQPHRLAGRRSQGAGRFGRHLRQGPGIDPGVNRCAVHLQCAHPLNFLSAMKSPAAQNLTGLPPAPHTGFPGPCRTDRQRSARRQSAGRARWGRSLKCCTVIPSRRSGRFIESPCCHSKPHAVEHRMAFPFPYVDDLPRPGSAAVRCARRGESPARKSSWFEWPCW